MTSRKNKQHLSLEYLCGLYGLWINQVLDELECAEPSSRGTQPYGFWAQENFTAIQSLLNMWTTELLQAGCLCEESAATWQKAGWLQCIFIHVPHQTGPWYLLLSRLFHHMDCPVPATLDKGEKNCSLKPESHKSCFFTKQHFTSFCAGLGLVWFCSLEGF